MGRNRDHYILSRGSELPVIKPSMHGDWVIKKLTACYMDDLIKHGLTTKKPFNLVIILLSEGRFFKRTVRSHPFLQIVIQEKILQTLLWSCPQKTVKFKLTYLLIPLLRCVEAL